MSQSSKHDHDQWLEAVPQAQRAAVTKLVRRKDYLTHDWDDTAKRLAALTHGKENA